MKPAVEKIIEHLIKNGPTSAEDLALALEEFSFNYVRSKVYKLHKNKRVHISRWKRQDGVRGRYVAYFRAGPGRDAPKPPPLTSAEASKRWWSRFGSVRNAARRTTDLGVWKGLI